MAQQDVGQDPTQSVPYGDAGIGGVGTTTAPAAGGVSTGDVLNFYNQIMQSITTPGGPGGGRQNVPQYSSQVTAGHPRMPVPMEQMPTGQNTQIRTPVGASLHDQRVAKQQSMGNLIGNMAGMVINQKMQERNQAQQATIQDWADAQIETAKANRIKEYYKNDPNNPAVKEADATLAKAQLTMKTIQNSKEWRAVEKAYKNYKEGQTDPSQMGQEGKNYQTGVTKAVDADTKGLNNDNPAESNTTARTRALESGQSLGSDGKPQGASAQGGPPTVSTASTSGPGTTPGGTSAVAGQQRPAVGASMQPQPLGIGTGQPQQAPSPDQLGRRPLPVINPATGQPTAGPVVTPKAQEERRFSSTAGGYDPNWKPLIQLPTQMVENPEYAAQQKFEQAVSLAVLRSVAPRMISEQGADFRANLKDTTDRWKQEQKDITELKKVDKQGQYRLQATLATNTKDLLVQDSKVRAIEFGIRSKTGDPRLLGIAGTAAGKELQTRIDKTTGDINTEETTIAKMQLDADNARAQGRDSTEVDSQIEEMKQLQKMNMERLKDLNGQMDKLGTAMSQLPDGAIPPNNTDPRLYKQATGITPGGGGGDVVPSGVVNVDRWNPTISQLTGNQFTNVPSALGAAIVMAESSGDPNALPRNLSPEEVARSGKGLMGLTPSVAAKYGVNNVFNPDENMRGGLNYLSDLITKNGGDLRKAIYDYGPHAKDPGYVDRVMAIYQRLQGGGGGTSGGGAAATVSTGQQPTGAGGSAVAQEPAVAHGAATEKYRRWLQRSTQDITGAGQAPSTGGYTPQGGELDAINRLLNKTGGQ